MLGAIPTSNAITVLHDTTSIVYLDHDELESANSHINCRIESPIVMTLFVWHINNQNHCDDEKHDDDTGNNNDDSMHDDVAGNHNMIPSVMMILQEGLVIMVMIIWLSIATQLQTTTLT